MPLFASLDIGSNTIRLLIADVKGSRINDVLYIRRITRLANGVDQTGRLGGKNIEASLAVLREFSSLISEHGVKSVGAIATSALREAVNSDIFIKKVFADTGIMINVISGEKEAELIHKGVFSSFHDSSLITHYTSLIIDIGGGSTEWILCKGTHLIDSGSVPAGVIKLSERFVTTDTVPGANTAELNREIGSFLEGIEQRIKHHINRNTLFVGTAGTFTTLASIDMELETYSREKVHLHKISLTRLRDISSMLLALPLTERKKVKGLEPERADLIIPGVRFTINVMERFEFDTLIVSDYGLLEGVLFEIAGKTDEKNIQETFKP